MDESDPLITFDSDGVCNHCRDWERDWAAKLELEKQYPEGLLKLVKESTGLTRLVGDGYDAVIGLSGGADSSYAYHLAKGLGLKVLPIHFDNGYDLPVATGNVRRLVDHWGDHLKIVKVDGEEFKWLQRAFLQSGTTGLEIPTDHAIKAATYNIARELGIRNILNGCNLATESHGTAAWTEGHSDWKYINEMAKRYGVQLKTFPHYTWWDLATWMHEYNWISILDWTRYDRDEAIKTLGEVYGYEPYGFKHMESRITRFLHGYIIPRRFGWDTRRSRLAAMVSSGQMTRDAALEMLRTPAYPAEQMEEDRKFVCKRLNLTADEFESLMNLPLKHFSDYPSQTRDMKRGKVYRALRWAYHAFR